MIAADISQDIIAELKQALEGLVSATADAELDPGSADRQAALKRRRHEAMKRGRRVLNKIARRPRGI